MTLRASPSAAVAERAGWRRLVFGLVWRSVRTVAGYGLAGLGLFLIAALVIQRDVDASWLPLLSVPYVLLGAVVGANVGLVTALRRETGAIAERSAWLLSPLVDRALDELAIPDEGIETAKLRGLAELEGIVRPGSGRIERLLAGFALRRTLENAGVRALQTRLLAVVERAEAEGDTSVRRAAVEAAAREGIGAAMARELDIGWRTNRTVALGIAALAFASLPLLAVLAG